MVMNAQQMITRMGTGVNLGEVFERNDLPRDSSFVSPLLKAYASKGFKSVRIPVTWLSEDRSKCVLDDPIFMKQLDNAVYYSIALGMCVILDIHFEVWILNHYDGSQMYKDTLWTLWQRIVNRYKSIAQENLVYEVLNEPVSF